VKVAEDAARMARRIITLLAAPYMIGEHEVIIGVSVGVAISSQQASAAEILLKNADLALYWSKAHGRGTFRFFEPGIDSVVRRQAAL
jgi:predicted signal transduction protein with EAL and GGDEF domain